METSYAELHIKSLCLAKMCAEFGARIKTIAHITGLEHKELVRLFFVDANSAPRGRPPDSPEWYHQANLIEKVETSIFASIFAKVNSLGFGPADSLIGAYKVYREHCAHAPRVSFDRAFDLVCHLKGIWTRRQPQLAISVCAHCRSQYVAALGDRTLAAPGCPFCKLVKRYQCDRRIQESFPVRSLPTDFPLHYGLLATRFGTNDRA
jgi:flagellar transcriptional activator FlhC